MAMIFQTSFAILIALSGVVLAISEGGPIPAATGPIAWATLYFVDWQRRWQLSQAVLTTLALAAFAAAGLEYLFGGIDAPLVSAGHLLCYLTWMLLCNSKRDSVYWFLLALSVLQVSLAVFLSSRVEVGIGLVTYMLLAIWTLSVFHVYRSLRLAHGAARLAADSNQNGFGVRHGLVRPIRGTTLGGGFLRMDAALAAASLGVALLLFLFIPRTWLNAAVPGERDSGEPITGFSTSVRLGDLGEILESTAPVMTVKLFHYPGDRPFTEEEYARYLGPVPLFRGATQEFYESGFWQRLRRGEQVSYSANRSFKGQVRQQVALLPTGSDLLFVHGDVTAVTMDTPPSRLELLELSDEFICRQLNGTARYDVFCTWESRDTDLFRQRTEAQRLNDVQPELERRLIPAKYSDRLRDYLQLNKRTPERVVQIRNLARSLTDGAASPAEAAQRLLNYMQEGDRFIYSLEMGVANPRIDPVEDFLFNRKQGHCEYFAASMVLLLRSADIPARLVTGFKGGVYSPETQAFHIQQLHAHAWAEGYLDGHWVTFDPTPLARDLSVQEQQDPAPGRLHQSSLWIWLWVVRYSRYEQRYSIYQPFIESVRFVGELVLDLFRGRGEKLKELIDFLLNPRRWLSGSGALLLAVLALLAWGGVWTARRLRRVPGMLQTLMRQLDLTGGRETIRVPFYERFLELVRQLGIERRPEQTAGEFAGDAWKQMQSRFPGLTSSLTSRELAAAFNEVRFGGRTLPEDQLQRLDGWLQQLDTTLQQLSPSQDR